MDVMVLRPGVNRRLWRTMTQALIAREVNTVTSTRQRKCLPLGFTGVRSFLHEYLYVRRYHTLVSANHPRTDGQTERMS
jgi:hypothetical protein